MSLWEYMYAAAEIDRDFACRDSRPSADMPDRETLLFVAATACCIAAGQPVDEAGEEALEQSLPSADRLQAFYERTSAAAVPAFLSGPAAARELAAHALVPALAPFGSGSRGVLPGSVTVIAEARVSGIAHVAQHPLADRFDADDLVAHIFQNDSSPSAACLSSVRHRPAAQSSDADAPPAPCRFRSLVARYEGLAPPLLPPFAARLLGEEEAVRQVRRGEEGQSEEQRPAGGGGWTSQVDTLHLYASGPHASALPAHTDPHDVFVLGAFGEKRWAVCSPGGADGSLGWRLRAKLTHRCADVSESELSDGGPLRCEEYVVRPGDVLYIPALHLHWAQAAAGGSAHLSVGLRDVQEEGRAVSAVARARRLVACTLVRPGYALEALQRGGGELVLLRTLVLGGVFLFLWSSSRRDGHAAAGPAAGPAAAAGSAAAGVTT